MEVSKLGDCITVDYEGLLENGEVFESTQQTGVLEFTLGTASVIMGFEEGMIGVAIGETKDIILKPEEGYGERQEDLIQELDRSVFGDKSNKLQKGMILHLNMPKDGKDQQIPATVTELSAETVTVDYNHPLAGHTLTYKVTLKSIKAGKSPIVHVPGGDVDNYQG
ncbi:MAG: peptidylprolyl isomerase [Desulfobulbaceae bacterium]|jgi:FKBP-type peptidyl-prolyl cis-trans isomerase 2|nr:peptidylprolyl isomerase [Desulfobulbaceae bacterium]